MNKFWRFTIISPLLGILCFLLAYYSQNGSLPNLENRWTGYVPSALFTLIAGYGALGMGQYLNRLVSWKQKHALRFLIQATVLFAWGLLVMAIYSEFFVMNPKPDMSYSQLWLIYRDDFFKILIILLLIVVCYTLLDFMVFSYNELRKEEVRSAEMVNNQLNLQFEALRSQLSPHFLFNSLNTISSLIFKDPDMAERFIRRFAATYRFILEKNDHPLIPLSEELEFVRAYNFLLEVRFNQAFRLNIDLPEQIQETLVPPMCLQMLVENAIKHNTVSRTTPLEVTIGLSGDFIKVSNNINPLRTQPESFHIGIENIRKRYAFFTTRGIEMSKSEDFTVNLPLIPCQA